MRISCPLCPIVLVSLTSTSSTPMCVPLLLRPGVYTAGLWQQHQPMCYLSSESLLCVETLKDRERPRKEQIVAILDRACYSTWQASEQLRCGSDRSHLNLRRAKEIHNYIASISIVPAHKPKKKYQIKKNLNKLTKSASEYAQKHLWWEMTS